jgi:hypothetical protein
MCSIVFSESTLTEIDENAWKVLQNGHKCREHEYDENVRKILPTVYE